MDKFWVRDDGGGKYTVAITLSYRHEAVCCEQDWCRNVVKFKLLVLPCSSEISFQMWIFLKLRVAVGRQHFTVCINVDARIVCLFQKQFQIVKIVSTYNNKRSFFNRKWNFSWNGSSIAFRIGFVQKLHASVIDLSGFQDVGEKSFEVFFTSI